MDLTLNEQLLPIDPDGWPYVLDKDCRAQLAGESRILR
jgi:hypothetical protein